MTSYGKCQQCQTFERLFRTVSGAGTILMLCAPCLDRQQPRGYVGGGRTWEPRRRGRKR